MISLHKKEISLKLLKHWFEREKRELPWRKKPEPYRVWVSEVMLQQTRASVVIPYFERWMEQFPTIESLAHASEEEVIKFWEGLGYYSRARNLHGAAKYLCERHSGELPAEEESLQKIKGLGPYTVGAILSFAFHKKAAAVDGNVLRVMSRWLGIAEEIDRARVRKAIERQVLEILPEEEPWITMEAFIELGATVCAPRADCRRCPLQKTCAAYLENRVEEFPKKRKRAPLTTIYRDVFVVEHEGAFLIQKHGNQGLMGGLCEFPYVETGKKSQFFSQIKLQKPLPSISHTFTRYQAHLNPSLWKAKKRFSETGLEWVELKRLSELAFSSGHRRVLMQVFAEYADFTY